MTLKEYNQYLDEIMPFKEVDVENKKRNIRSTMLYTFLRLQQMFKYEGLPASIPARYLEFYLMTTGHCAIISHEGELYALRGGFGGEPDAYYEPLDYVIANPYLKLSKVYKRGVDCVVMGNDSAYYGLFPLVSKYTTLMAENELSMNISVINARIMSIITANTDNEKSSAEEYLNKVKDGKLGAIMQDAFFDGIKTQPYANASQANALTNLIEYEQYLKASLFNELGLNANYNMKRESINSNESQLNDDMLTPLIDNMLATRKRCLEEVNEMFGTDISVEFDSAWRENEITTQIEMEGLQNESGTAPGGDDDIVGAADDMDNGDLPTAEEETDQDAEKEDMEEDRGEDTPEEDVTDPEEILNEIQEDIEEIKEGLDDDKKENE